MLATDHAIQIQVLLKGQNNGAMPSWKQLSDTDLAAVATYTKNSWSNKTGQIVQPAEIASVRGGKDVPPPTTSQATPDAAPRTAALSAPTLVAASNKFPGATR